tara:strand:- start:889 stop:2451 length:1563 start_codon:yes stop_codon:yes gene_type:complete
MGDATDFDIDNYNIEELVNIIGLGSEIPLTNEKIVSTISKFTEKFEKKFEKKELGEKEKTNFIDFFYQIQEKLLNNKKEETVRDLFDDEIVTESITRKAIPVNSREPRKAVLYDKDIMGETQITGMQNVNPAPFDNITADYKNPLLRNTAKQLITIDSKHRTISKYATTGKGDIGGCPDSGTQYKTAIAQTSTNFTVNLDPPIKNVLEITFESANIPNEWYVFSKDYGTDYFVEKKAVGPAGNYTYTDISNVYIENGKYNSTNLIDELNSKTDRLIFTYSEISNKITVKNNMSYSMGIDWYSLNVPMCSTTGNGGKIDYNLGWLLGFRNTDYILEANASITGEATLDITGPTYLYIALDDFNNNKPNQNLVSFQNNVSSFAMPSYYVRTTMGPTCDLTNPEYINPSNSCGKKYANKDLSSNLTSKQRYTIDQIKLAMSGQRTERYSSPNSADILSKINVQLEKTHTQVKEVNLEYKKRFYFGPVNLRKLHVRLLNDKGMDINLNNNDWDFSFYVTTVYQP